MSKPFYPFIVLLLCCVLVGACAAHSQSTALPATPLSDSIRRSLPPEVSKLEALAKANDGLGADAAQLAQAVAAYEKLVDLYRESDAIREGEASWRLARLCFLMAQRDLQHKAEWLQAGEPYGARAVELLPERPEPLYFLALIKGRLAESEGIGALDTVKQIERLARESARLDPDYERGGATRMLAMLYARTPGWPVSIGDLDTAIEMAQELVERDDYPLNRLIYAQVLIEADESAEAAQQLEKVLEAPIEGRWALEAHVSRRQAEELLGSLNDD